MAVHGRNVTAAILAGGLGTRLRPVIGNHAKVVAQVGGRPFLGYVFDQLIDAGVSRAVVCVGFRAGEIVEAFGDRYGKLAIEYSREQTPLGTGGALRRAMPRLDSPSVLVLNGDTYCIGGLGDLVRWHERHRASCSMLLSHRDDTRASGRVRLSRDGMIEAFDEKTADASPGWVSAGAYVMDRGFIGGIPAGRTVSLERDILPACAAKHLRGFRAKEDFLDIGTREGLVDAEAYFESREIQTSLASVKRAQHVHLNPTHAVAHGH